MSSQEHLLQAVEDMKSDIHLPHIPLKREGDLRASKTVDDIMAIFIRLDESLKMTSLHRHVAESPDTMRCMRLYNGDLRPLMLTFDKLSERQGKRRRLSQPY